MSTAGFDAGNDELPLLSIVVPMYDVEHYLSECLDSLLEQSYDALEIILVDDGSTDATADIARRYARLDQRIVFVAQANAGLGAARNAGARLATGRFLAFVDSDDTVPHRAYERLVGTLLETGSDLAVGSAEELVDGRYGVPAWLVPMHRRERRRVTLDRAPDILHNAFAWTKVFRHSFYRHTGLVFPEGVYYEDHVPMTRAYLAARSLDILPDVVYRWRTRPDGLSITQRRHELRNLVDALAAKRTETELVSCSASAVTRRYWYSIMFDDLRPYARCVAGASNEYWATLREGIRALLEHVPTTTYDDIAVRVRLMVWLVATDRRSDLEALFRQLGDKRSKPALVRREGGDTLAVVDLSDPASGVPPRLFDLARSDRQLRARLVEVTAPDCRTVGLRGRVQLLGVSDRSQAPSVSLRLRDRRSQRADLSVDGAFEGECSGNVERPAPGAAPPWAFSAVVRLPDASPPACGAERDLAGDWAVDVVVTYDDVTVQGPFTGASPAALAALHHMADGGAPAMSITWHWGPGLHVSHERAPV